MAKIEDIKTYMHFIARQHGILLSFKDIKGGFFMVNHSGTPRITISNKAKKQDLISIFCHEMGHVFFFKRKKFWKYHNPRYFGNRTSQFKSYDSLVRYALRAEIATDKKGREICKEYFPSIKYIPGYKDNNISYAFLDGYYRGN